MYNSKSAGYVQNPCASALRVLYIFYPRTVGGNYQNFVKGRVEIFLIYGFKKIRPDLDKALSHNGVRAFGKPVQKPLVTLTRPTKRKQINQEGDSQSFFAMYIIPRFSRGCFLRFLPKCTK